MNMETNSTRVDEFREEVAAMNVRPPEDAAERRWLLAGVILPIVGLIVIMVGWFGASGTAEPSEQLPYLLSGGALGVGLIVIGGALFVRYSTTRYLRFWLVRTIYEQRTQTDREVEVLRQIEVLLSQRAARSQTKG